ncbi:MAG: helix-turn-helix transcriptional regulator [Methanosarcinaceae archaeon]
MIEQRRRLRERFIREAKLLPKDITVTSMDEKFLKKVLSLVEENISESAFDTQLMALQSGLSRSQLHRKLRPLTDQSPREFIRIIRLRRAAQLLERKAGNVTQIAYEVGFNSISHFAKRFKEMFGVSPSEYGRNKI